MKKLIHIYNNTKMKVLGAGLFLAAVVPGSVFAQLDDGVQQAQPDGVASNLLDQGGVFQTVANILLLILGAVAVIMLIIGGFRYVVSGGDSGAVEGAKNTILYAIIGIIVAFLAWAAVDFVITQLGQGGTT